MIFLTKHTSRISEYRIYLILGFLAFILIFPILYLTQYSGLNNAQLAILFSIPIVIICLFRFEFAVYFLILTLFFNIQISKIFPSELASIIIALSFLLTHKFKFEEIKNPLNKYFLIFSITGVLSIYNSVNIPLNLLYLLRLVAFFIVLTAVQISIKNYAQIRRYLYFFLIMCLINGLDIIYLSVTTDLRVFGFAGIWYVDYVGLALVISLTFLLYNKKMKIYFISSLIILIAALIFTQTRNAWLSSGISMLIIIVHFIFKSSDLGYNRKKVIIWSLFVIALIIFVSLQAQNLNPGVFKRVSPQSLQPISDENNNDVGISSFMTRIFIWHTAFQAFLAHPIIGIGLYSFPFSSQYYFTIDPIAYKLFVKNLPAHTTILAVMAEVGIIGSIAFLLFIYSLSKFLIRTLKDSLTEISQFYSLIFIYMQIFIFISMIMTDAWLWGHQLILWAILLAFFISNRKLINTGIRE